MLSWIVDTLASRYGWTRQHILDDMYWEDVWEHLEIASNINTYERNQELYFQFCLHAGSKEAIKNWKDSPLPFPDKKYKENKPHYGGLDQLPRHIPVKKLKTKSNGK